MPVFFVRHGEPRRTESDPGLTSFGRRMAREAGLWLADQGLPHHPTILHTDTARTQETAEEIGLVLDATTAVIPSSPETWLDWEVVAGWLADHMRHSRIVQPDPNELIVMVGHHPTVKMLLDELGPPPRPADPGHFCVGLMLETRPAWRIADVWPGRLGG